jgi:diguanylate cyclase (GGDEF)-like protein/PAS domain S-box-containing protein
MNILLAEDDPISAKVITRALESLDHTVQVYADGVAAWQAFQDGDFDLVITDWMMPRMEGPELCKQIRTLGREPYPFLVVLTSRDDRDDKFAALDAGADDFLLKPLDREELVAKISVAERIVDIQSRYREQARRLSDANAQLGRTTALAEQSRNRFSQLFESLPVPCFTFDHQLKIMEANQKCVDTFSRPAHILLGQPIREILGRKLVVKSAISLLQEVLRDEGFEDAEWTDGKRHYLVSAHSLRGVDGSVTGGIASCVDVTAQRRAESERAKSHEELRQANSDLKIAKSELEQLAVTDGLTRIANHRAFQDRLSAAYNEFARGRSYALAMIDVDYFKKFNDEFGHQAGDEALLAVATALRSATRKTDIVARYGGEEFAVIFADADADAARRSGERLRAAVEAIECEYRQLTVSIGVTTFSAAHGSAEDIIRTADEALYAAKRAGRNRVVMSGDPTSSDRAA